MSAQATGVRSGGAAIRRIRGKAWRLPPRDMLTTVHAVMVLLVVELAIRSVSLPRLCVVGGIRLGGSVSQGPNARRLEMDELPPKAVRALRATRRVTSRWPFCAGPCLRSALVGGHLIRELEPTLRIGVAPNEFTIRAHAWLEVNGRPLEDVSGFRPFDGPARCAPSAPTGGGHGAA